MVSWQWKSAGPLLVHLYHGPLLNPAYLKKYIVSIFISGTAVGTRTTAGDFMRRDEVRTIFSVYHLWLLEGRDAIAAERPEHSRVAQIVHRRVKTSPRKETAQEFFTPSSASSFLAS
jgi:hypothetical protein